VDGKVVSTQKQQGSLPLVKPLDVAFQIGLSGANPVDDQYYKVPFNFTGTIKKVTIVLDPPKLTPEDVRKLETANRAGAE
jgi:arylsulfatase